jgi:hypothetical protein
MKIQQQHLSEITSSFKLLGLDAINKHRAYLVSPENPRKPKDLEMRLRWDILNSTKGARWICDNLYPYLNDTHIDSALKHVMSEFANP